MRLGEGGRGPPASQRSIAPTTNGGATDDGSKTEGKDGGFISQALYLLVHFLPRVFSVGRSAGAAWLRCVCSTVGKLAANLTRVLKRPPAAYSLSVGNAACAAASAAVNGLEAGGVRAAAARPTPPLDG
jgi:hypothetical protein